LGVLLPMSAGAYTSVKWPRTRLTWLTESIPGVLCCSGFLLTFFNQKHILASPVWNLTALCPLVCLTGLIFFEMHHALLARKLLRALLPLLVVAAVISIFGRSIYYKNPVTLVAPAFALLSLPGLGGLFVEIIRTRSWGRLPLVVACLPAPCIVILLAMSFLFYFE